MFQICLFRRFCPRSILLGKAQPVLQHLQHIGYSAQPIRQDGPGPVFEFTENQKVLLQSLDQPAHHLVIVQGPAGSGKTFIACKYAIENFQKGRFGKIIITRPTVTTDEDLGSLPGDINQKMNPFLIPVLDIFREQLGKAELDKLQKDDKIEILPLAFIQGRTFKNAIIIADEMQNSKKSQMNMLLTRIGTQSKIIVTGDPDQAKEKENGLADVLERLWKEYPAMDKIDMNKDGIDAVILRGVDVKRHLLVPIINKLYKVQFRPPLKAPYMQKPMNGGGAVAQFKEELEQAGTVPRKGVCAWFNMANGCDRDHCTWKHVCIKCGGEHALRDCRP